MQGRKNEREEKGRVEMEKLLKDRECIHCAKFFECEGKPKEVKYCINYAERKNKDGRCEMDQNHHRCI